MWRHSFPCILGICTAGLDEDYPELIWLSESVRPHFITNLTAAGHVAHHDKEMYSAFDILYDYDVYNDLKAYLEGKAP